MKKNCKAIIKKLSFPLDNNLFYNVQLWYEWHAGKSDYVYAGNGKYFSDIETAEQYAKERSTVPVEYDI